MIGTHSFIFIFHFAKLMEFFAYRASQMCKLYFTFRMDMTSECVSTCVQVFQPLLSEVARIFSCDLTTAHGCHVLSQSGIKFNGVSSLSEFNDAFGDASLNLIILGTNGY